MNMIVIMPAHVMYQQDWFGWIHSNKIQGNFGYNQNWIEFEHTVDLLAFKLKFGL